MAEAQLIHDALIARTPSDVASSEARAQLRAYPPALLRRAAAYPIRIWLLDPGEPVSSAGLLDGTARARRWHWGDVGLMDCAGLTVPVARGVLVVAPWDRPTVLRHELGHALSVLLNGSQRCELDCLYRAARAERRLLVPLAGVTVGEYVACGLAHYARTDLRPYLARKDPGLKALLESFWQPDEADLPARSKPAGGLLGGLSALLGRRAQTFEQPAAG